MEKRQAQELNTWRLDHVTLNEPQAESTQVDEEIPKNNNYSEQSIQKISKAQKRRDKKANAEKERNQRIIEQEALNVFGKRNVETETIKKILSERELMLHEISSDGNW